MTLLTQLLVAAAAWLTGLAAALPPHSGTADLTGNLLSGGKASLKQVRRENYKVNGVVSMYQTYLKHGVPIPQHLHSAVARTGLIKHTDMTGTVIATPVDVYGSEYTVPVSIGTPPQVLRLIFDTGSADTWGFSTLMPNGEVDGQTRYDPTRSSTAKRQQGSTWNITYGDHISFASGVVFTDTVDVGGISVENQAFEAAANVSDPFTETANLDGLLGMGFRHLNMVKPRSIKTFMDHAKASLYAPLFTADLKYNSPGTYNLGYIDPSSHEGDITYVPVYPQHWGYWNFSSSGFAVGNGPFTPAEEFAIADTGTSYFYLSRNPVRAYYAGVHGAVNSTEYGAYVFPCDATLPSFTFAIDKARFTIPGHHLNVGSMGQNLTESCYGGLQWAGDGGVSVFGVVALKAALVVFRYPVDEHDLPTLGWANKKLD